MKKFMYGTAAILLPTILGVLTGGLISGQNSFLESFQEYGYICLPIATVTYFAGLRVK